MKPRYIIRMAALLMALCVLISACPALAADSMATPDCATVVIELPALDVEVMAAAFYGEQAAQLELERQTYEFDGAAIEVVTGSLPDLEYALSFSGNYISMQRYHSIPLTYRSEGEGAYAPPPSKVEGAYTQAEAVELARQFVQQEMGIAADVTLALADVRPEDPDKERSRAYVISFAYSWEGAPLIGATEQAPQVMPRLTVGVTDEGIVSLEGDVIELTGGRQGESEPLSSDDVARLNPNDQLDAGGLRLCYKVGPAHEGRLAWYLADEGDAIPTYLIMAYDAYTGERLT